METVSHISTTIYKCMKTVVQHPVSCWYRVEQGATCAYLDQPMEGSSMPLMFPYAVASSNLGAQHEPGSQQVPTLASQAQTGQW